MLLFVLIIASWLLHGQADTILLCRPGQQVMLSATTGQFAYQWSPATGLSNPTVANPTVQPTATTWYVARIIGEAESDNLIQNPDFSAGNAGVTSDYPFVSSINTQGLYGVNVSAANLNPTAFANCPDHTSGTGQMMVVDGSPTANEKVWCQSVAVEANANYAFSTWLASVNPANPAQLQFSINGARLGSIFSAPATVCNWRQFYATWNAGPATQAEICVVNQNTNPTGNDFALDDFAFFKIQDVILDSTLVLIAETTHLAEVVRKPDCGAQNGSIAVTSTSNGPARFSYALDGGPFLSDSVFRGLTAGVHTLSVRNDHPALAGEVCLETLEVELSQGDCPVYLPTAFSPNGDGINDDFRVFSHAGFLGNVRSMVVYNRWGGTVFSIANASPDDARWDGRVGGEPAPAGTYLYVLELENGEGGISRRQGAVVLVR